MAVIHMPYLLVIKVKFRKFVLQTSHFSPVGLGLSRGAPEEPFIPGISLGVFWPHQYEISDIMSCFFIISLERRVAASSSASRAQQ